MKIVGTNIDKRDRDLWKRGIRGIGIGIGIGIGYHL